MAERSRDRKKRKKEQTEYFFDYSLLFVVLFLMGFGLVMIYSASSYEAQQDFGSGTYYLRKQLVADILGLVVMMVMANIPYRFWQRFTTLAYFASLALIPVVLTPLGVESHGARRWGVRVGAPEGLHQGGCDIKVGVPLPVVAHGRLLGGGLGILQGDK